MPDRLCRHQLHSRGNGRVGVSPRSEEFLGHHLELSFDLCSMFLAVYPPQLPHPGREPGRVASLLGRYYSVLAEKAIAPQVVAEDCVDVDDLPGP